MFGMTAEPTRAHILVVDDDRGHRALLEAVLAEAGHDVSTATDGPTALGLLGRGDIDLVLLDVVMRGVDGMAVCRTIREQLGLRLLPVVLVSAFDDHDARIRAHAAGADDYLTKPYDHGELLARVASLLLLKRHNDALEVHRRAAQVEARRWRLVSKVTAWLGSPGATDSLEELARGLAAAIGEELPASLRLGFEAEVADGAALVVNLGPEPGADGVVYVQPPPGRALSPDDRALVASLVPHLANAVAHVRLGRAHRELEEARGRLHQLVVHDLQNPLAAITMNLLLVRKGSDAAAAQRAVDDALQASGQLRAMLLDFLDVGRAEDGRLPFDPRPAALAPTLLKVIDGMRPLIAQRGAQVFVQLAADLPSIEFDDSLIARLAQNLLNNAARFARKRVEVDARVVGADVVVTIGNDGPDVPSELRAHLFEKYGQVNATQGSANRGLGLYLCRLVVDRHRGSIAVIDRPDGGACFVFRLPTLALA